MAGEIRLADEKFVSGSTTYHFQFAPGEPGNTFASSTPFPTKIMSGDKKYSDTDPLSAIAFTDLSGGMGQEWADDPTRYYDATNADARGGRIVLGPYKNVVGSNPDWYADEPTSNLSVDVGTGHATKIAFPMAGFNGSVTRVWVLLAATSSAAAVTVDLYSHSAIPNEPNASLASATLSRDDLRGSGRWVCATFAAPVALALGTTYWVVVTHTGASTAVRWWGQGVDGGFARGCEWDGANWQIVSPLLAGGYFLVHAELTDNDTVAKFSIGMGQDGVRRIWAAEARNLVYYTGTLSAADSLTATRNAVHAHPAGTTWQAADTITDLCWYRSPADTYANLYIAVGDAQDIQVFDGDVGHVDVGETFAAIAGGYDAHALAVHNEMLWTADQRTQVRGWNGSAWGNLVQVGDDQWPVAKMVSFNSALYCGKQDGLYRVEYLPGYPIAGTPTATRILDFSQQEANGDNFSFMLEHQGDLYFNVGPGVMRFTPGGVLSVITPDVGLNVDAGQRAYAQAAVSTGTALWVSFVAAPKGSGSLMAYVDGHWHPVTKLGWAANPVRALLADPGILSPEARIWGAGLGAVYHWEMPVTTQRTWLIPYQEYVSTGALDYSWVDGGLRTLDKDWISVQVHCSNMTGTVSNATVAIQYRTEEGASWTGLSSTTANGVTTMAFGASTYGKKIQLRAVLTAGENAAAPITFTPHVMGVVLKYLVRPDNTQSYTRTYWLYDQPVMRQGMGMALSLAEQLANLRTLQESKEPLAWTPAEGGSAKNVHIISYAGSLRRETIGGVQDQLVAAVTVNLQEV